MVVVQLVLYAGRSEEDSAETNAAEEQTSTSQSVEAEAPSTNNDPFVDDSDVVNDTEGENRLVLITCGGKFVGGQLGYEDNIITVAEPVAPVEGAEAPVEGGVEAPAEAPAA